MNFFELTGASNAAWLRGFLAVIIAVLASLLGNKDDLDWKAFGFAIVAGLVTWKAFLDQSLSDKPKDI